MSRNGRGKTGANGGISTRQEAVAALLAAGFTKARAARECKVGATTLDRWKQLPAFQDRVAELRKELTDRAVGRLADLMAGAAADALHKLLAAKSEAVRLDSVKAVFELFVSVTNAAELKSRIEQIEAGQAGRGSR